MGIKYPPVEVRIRSDPPETLPMSDLGRHLFEPLRRLSFCNVPKFCRWIIPQLLPQVSIGFPRRTNSCRISQFSPVISFFGYPSGCSKCSLDSTIGRSPTRVNHSPDPFQIFSDRIRSTPIRISSETTSV